MTETGAWSRVGSSPTLPSSGRTQGQEELSVGHGQGGWGGRCLVSPSGVLCSLQGLGRGQQGLRGSSPIPKLRASGNCRQRSRGPLPTPLSVAHLSPCHPLSLLHASRCPLSPSPHPACLSSSLLCQAPFAWLCPLVPLCPSVLSLALSHSLDQSFCLS